jgi:hypothetical protein
LVGGKGGGLAFGREDGEVGDGLHGGNLSNFLRSL